MWTKTTKIQKKKSVYEIRKERVSKTQRNKYRKLLQSKKTKHWEKGNKKKMKNEQH